MRLFNALAVFAALATVPLAIQPTQAQEAGAGTCRYAGLQFTAPSTIRIGDEIMRCNGTIWFTDSSATTTNCIFASTLFTTGAVVSEGGNDVVCLADGTWSDKAAE